MPISLDRLPFDVLFYVSSHLQIDDILSLGHTCRQLKALLQENTLCRRAIETHVPYTKEARLAQEQQISYCDALSIVHDRRHAFSTAQPFSAYIMGQGNEYLYRDGILCILAGNIIRVLDADTSAEICEIDILGGETATPEGSTSSGEPKISLLSFNDDLVTVLYEKKGRSNTIRMLVFSTKQEPPSKGRQLTSFPLNSSYKLFVRHTADCVYYGTYTAQDDEGHHAWELKGVALTGKYDISECDPPLQLERFFGSDVGSTIAFEIHNEHFYAVSNQTSFEVEEIDWTSFYHCIRFPLGNPRSDAVEAIKTVYRRQHDEGPIHDSWTDITLQFDEATDRTMIVEARREWLATTSRQQRTFYISDFEWDKKSPPASEDGSPVLGASIGPLLPEDDAYTSVIDSSNNPNYAPKEYRPSWKFHPEISPECGSTRSFILARTKFKGYNYSCNTFLDFVEDERCCSESSSTPCLRLRVGTRREAPEKWTHPCQDTSSKAKSVSPSLQDDDVVYRHPPIRMWPPPSSQCACSKRLHTILNPALPGPAHGKSISGVLDKRRFVYMVRPGRSDNALGTIVVVNFTRGALPSKPNEAVPTDHGGSMEGQFNPSRWEWTPGACKKGVCW
ncbi:hypothetical protein K458DRAFT_441452 [Lentithecium fluviatile CBS 122367]|uniref:F-box domain-containing protein n=1 Tax=Lentithecium fluviatile CBS 122367 TaxID=1168545 RepID=A0A6G1J8X6_9PLEO|nr:hypothetical protein K458DRAFT_441452 [Lentithecium fluviatile CBS 122367]